MKQLELHNAIDGFFRSDIKLANLQFAQSLLQNEDSRRYFFDQANEVWLQWLWDFGFLDAIKGGANTAPRGVYRLPELGYLEKICKINPVGVSKIIESVEISEDNCSPEVLLSFLRIIGTFPVEQIVPLIDKILSERWVYLMRDSDRSSYDFEVIVKVLVEKKESVGLLKLSQALLTLKDEDDIRAKNGDFGRDDFFCVKDIDESGIFSALITIDEHYLTAALKVTTDTMAAIIKMSEADEGGVFEYKDAFGLYDVDFFNLDFEGGHTGSYRANEKNFVTTIKVLAESEMNKKSTGDEDKRSVLDLIDNIPSSRLVWRLRLFVLAQQPLLFKSELKDSFFRLFEGKNDYDIEGGAEYKQALKICFPLLDEDDQRLYVANVINYFVKKAKDNPEQKWHKQTGYEILSTVFVDLNGAEKQKAAEVFGKELDAEYVPEPSIGRMRSGTVIYQAPDELEKYTIKEIISRLKTNWTPERLSEEFKSEDYFRPRGAEGLCESIKQDVKKRTADYLNNIELFFDRENIHPSYIHSLLRGIEEMLRNDQSLSFEQIENVFGLFGLIKISGERAPFKGSDDKSWLADWIGGHSVAVDVLLHILRDKTYRGEKHEGSRPWVLSFLSYLFTVNGSPSRDDEGPESSEPYSVAINSVRGRAYEAFVVLVENDGKTLREDVKPVYRAILCDESLAVRFVIGRYLASFYFRDIDFVRGLFAEIFPKDDSEKKDIYLASWEGYLSNVLYQKLFIDLGSFYDHAIALSPSEYTKRKYSTGLDEALGVHLALAFIYFGLDIENDPLLVKFWSIENPKRHQEFISFIGRTCLTQDGAGDRWFKENKVDKERLIAFWSWAVGHVTEPEALSGFGFWVNQDHEILDDSFVAEKMAETLKKSNGEIDWDYGLLRRLPALAAKNSDSTLEIIEHLLLGNDGRLNPNRRVPFFSLDGEIRESLGVIYDGSDAAMKVRVSDLISRLITEGSSMFWGLKEVIKEA